MEDNQKGIPHRYLLLKMSTFFWVIYAETGHQQTYSSSLEICLSNQFVYEFGGLTRNMRWRRLFKELDRVGTEMQAVAYLIFVKYATPPHYLGVEKALQKVRIFATK